MGWIRYGVPNVCYSIVYIWELSSQKASGAPVPSQSVAKRGFSEAIDPWPNHFFSEDFFIAFNNVIFHCRHKLNRTQQQQQQQVDDDNNIYM